MPTLIDNTRKPDNRSAVSAAGAFAFPQAESRATSITRASRTAIIRFMKGTSILRNLTQV